MKRVIAKYEPQRIISRKTKRKIVENPNGAHDGRGKTTGSATDLERTYHEVLRNISRKAPDLMVYNANQALNPYLSQVTNNLKQIYITDEAIRPATDDESRESRFDVDTSYAAPTLKSKKAKKLLKKYSQLNRTAIPAQSGHNIVPRPFSISQSSDSPVVTNIQVAQRKPSSTPAGFKHQHIARSSANILPLILPTDLFNPLPARRYVPIKRSNRLNPDGNLVTIISTEASVPTSLAEVKATFSNYVTYADVVGTTSNPLVAINSHSSFGSPEVPATTYVPIQTSASYTLQQQKNPYAIHKNEFIPKIATYNSPDGEKSSLAKLELELFKKFANLYLPNQPNVLHEPKAITQDYQNFSQPVQPLQQVSTSSYVTLKPVSPTLLKVEPIAPIKPTFLPYYDNRLLVSQNLNKKKFTDDTDNEESVNGNEQSRTENADETDKEIANKNIIGNHKIQINHGAYKIHKTPEQREEKDRNEEERNDRYQQRGHNYGYQNRYQEDDKSNKNDEKHKKYENSRHENNEDEENVDETQKDEYVNAGENEEEPNYDHNHQYNKSEYDQDDPEKQQHEKQRYDHKKYDEQNDYRNKHNHEIEVKRKFVNNNKYPYKYDEKYLERHDEKEDQQIRRHKDHEDESVAEDKLVTQRSKDQRARRQYKKQKKKQNNNNDTTHKRKYYRNKDSPPRDSHREEHEREEYSETNPKHVRKQYHRQQLNSDHNNDNEKVQDHVHGETQEHAHKHEEHHEKKKHGGNHKFEEGEGAEHEEEHHGHEGDKGKKGYKVWHEHEKAKKGHHDKEHASKEYDEKDGKEKKHEEKGGYHEEHSHGDAGKKTAEFGEQGEHKKGHSTHGQHSVHKKDEYEKKTEFYDEFNEDGGTEKHGEHHHEHKSEKGGHEKKGHHDVADHEEKHGKKGEYEKGGHHHDHKGHKIDEGHDHHHDHHHKHGKKEGHEHGRKWSFKKGDSDGHKDGDHKKDR